MEDLDSNKVIAEIINSNIDSLFDASNKFVSGQTNKLKARLKRTFSEYIQKIEEKYSTTKTIIYRDTPQSIEKFYEPIDLHNDKYDLSSPSIENILQFKNPIILTGTGGSGKSTFLKYLLLDTIKNKKLIPVFIELRDVENEKLDLVSYITKSLKLRNVNLDSDYIKKAFERGNFIFFFDGFDELSYSFSQKIGKEIDFITQNYSKCHFIITSRPGQEFISWTNFLELKTKPLTLEKAVNLVRRLNFDEEVKEKFIEDLQTGLYESHSSFFENPLLLSIMLISYRDSAAIPSELHNFYNLAFEALYYRHDASKSFKRPTMTDLPVHKGREILASFSFITYLKTKTSFNKYELKEFLSQALSLSNIQCDINHLITDLLRAYCMLLQDGTIYSYTHRSFQEYFAACFLISASEEKKVKIIEQFSMRADTDITLQLAYGMNPKVIEEKLIIPFISEVREKIGFKKSINKTVFKKFASTYFDRVGNFERLVPTLHINNDKVRDEYYIKSHNLSVIRFVIDLFEIDTINENTTPMPESLALEIFGDDDGNMPFNFQSLSKCFKNSEVLEWFVEHSIESNVLKEFLDLEERLKKKNRISDSIFNNILLESN